MGAESPEFPSSTQTIEESVRKFAATLKPNSTVLDVGCGLRPYARFFKGVRYTGMDVMESGRDSEGKVADILYDGLAFPMNDESYDAVICTQVLEHSIEPELLIAEIRRVLRKGGTGLLTVPLTWGEHEVPFDFRRYTTFGLKRLIEKSGLEVVHLSRISTGITAIAMLVSSEINAYRITHPSPDIFTRQVERFAGHLWRLLLFVWRKLYIFPRIYLDNLVIFRKP